MTQRELQVGDRVKVARTDGFYGFNKGKIGVIEWFRPGGAPEVKFENGETDYGYVKDLELIPAPSPLSITLPGDPPASISINGVTYVAQAEAAAEEKPEVKAGQVWRDDEGDYFIPSDDFDDDGELLLIYLNGEHKGVLANLPTGEMSFIAHSLREALTSGKLKPEDL